VTFHTKTNPKGSKRSENSKLSTKRGLRISAASSIAIFSSPHLRNIRARQSFFYGDRDEEIKIVENTKKRRARSGEEEKRIKKRSF
jgi:hypothetical protein